LLASCELKFPFLMRILQFVCQLEPWWFSLGEFDASEGRDAWEVKWITKRPPGFKERRIFRIGVNFGIEGMAIGDIFME
jgi:hypothetical protein